MRKIPGSREACGRKEASNRMTCLRKTSTALWPREGEGSDKGTLAW